MTSPRFDLFGLTAVVLIIFLCAPGPLVAGENPKKSLGELPEPDTGSALEFPNRDIFRPGEKIRLRVSYLGFTAGYLTTKVKTKSIDGREIYQLKVTGNSSGLAYWFYSVRDEFVSYVDATDYFSLGYDYEKNHGGEREFETVRYDHKKGLYFKNGKETGNIPPYSHDVLSALYFLRGQEMEVGNRYQFPVHVGDEAYRLELLVEGKDEVATSSRGWVEAFRIKPSLQDPQKEKEFKEKLKGEENKVRIWISDDSAKIPLQISVPAKVGTFWGYLSSYKPGKTK